MEIANKISKTTKFQEHLNEYKEKIPVGSKPLNELIMLPIQRLKRYEQLLKTLRNHMEPTHNDYEPLKETLEVIQDVIKHFKERHNTNKINQIQSKMKSSECARFFATRPKFVREDCLTILHNKKKENRVFFLFKEQLIVCSRSLN